MKDTIIEALNLSGKTLLNYFNKPIKTKIKESQSSIVTQADFASDKLIKKIIIDKFPTHNIISEESGFIKNNSEYTWVIDPLDGTSNFASGIPWFGVLICVFKNEIPIMGGAYLPVDNVLYFAEYGKGAFRNEIKLTMPENSELMDSLISFSVDYTSDEKFLNRGMEIYRKIVQGCRNVRSTNSLVDLIYVAEGKFGGCINMNTKIWDISALGLIISEAGGKMTDINGNELKYSINSESAETNFPVIAGTQKIIENFKYSR
jgi:myo-inositol-1(or 4)-monophosphatase